MKTTSIWINASEYLSTEIEAYYEALARQEEIYLEEIEEELRAIMIRLDSSLYYPSNLSPTSH